MRGPSSTSSQGCFFPPPPTCMPLNITPRMLIKTPEADVFAVPLFMPCPFFSCAYSCSSHFRRPDLLPYQPCQEAYGITLLACICQHKRL